MKRSIICLAAALVYAQQSSANENSKSVYVAAGVRGQSSPFTSDDSTQRILRQTAIEREGKALAEKGLYDAALTKYREALDPSLFNHEYEKATSIGAIVRIYARQGKFEDALKEFQWFIKQSNSGKAALEDQQELISLLNAKKTGSNKPVYDYIVYLRKRYQKFIPPHFGDSGYGLIQINKIIHLYNWMGDADGGIRFMEEILSSKQIDKRERADFERVKAAFEEDKRTGQKGHLQKVIETSDFISW